MKDSKGRSTELADERETRDVRQSVPDINHVLKRNPSRCFGNVLVHEILVSVGVLGSETFVDLEQVSGLFRKSDAALDF